MSPPCSLDGGGGSHLGASRPAVGRQGASPTSPCSCADSGGGVTGGPRPNARPELGPVFRAETPLVTLKSYSPPPRRAPVHPPPPAPSTPARHQPPPVVADDPSLLVTDRIPLASTRPFTQFLPFLGRLTGGGAVPVHPTPRRRSSPVNLEVRRRGRGGGDGRRGKRGHVLYKVTGCIKRFVCTGKKKKGDTLLCPLLGSFSSTSLSARALCPS